MIIGIVREARPGGIRAAATPATVGRLRAIGYDVGVEPGAGSAATFPDAAYGDAGAQLGNRPVPTSSSG